MVEKLIVRKLAPKAPLAEQAVQFITRRQPEARAIVDEITVDRPRRVAILWKRNIAGYGDGKAIVNAVEEMRESVGEKSSQYEVARVKKNGEERELRFWQGFVDSAKSREVKKIHSTGKVESRIIVEMAKKAQAKEYKARRNAGDEDAKVNRTARKLSAFVMAILRRGTMNMVVARELKPGRSVDQMKSSLYNAYSRLQDGILDPMNVFHGIGESAAEFIKNAQEGRYKVFVNLFLGAHPRLNEGVAAALNFNKITSRDAEDTKINVLGYSAVYEKFTGNEKLLIGLPEKWPLLGKLRLSRGQAWALILKSPSQYETATDFNMSLADKALAVRAKQVLSTPAKTQYDVMYKQDVAKAVGKALDTVPNDIKLTNTVSSAMSDLTKRVDGMTNGAVTKAKDMAGKVAEFAGLKPKAQKGKVPTEEEKAKSSIKKTLAEMAEALKKPMSIIDYTKAMAQMGEAFLQTPGLSPAEATNWKQAVAWGKYVIETYGLAKGLENGQTVTPTN